MNTKNQRYMVWLSIALATVYFAAIAFFLGFIPPPPPSLSAVEVMQLYAGSTVQFRIGVVIALLSGGFFIPWAVVISAQLMRHEKGAPIWTMMQALASGITSVLMFLPPLFWGVAAFNAGRDPAITLLMHELAFLTFTAPVSLVPFQAIPVIAIAFSKKDEELSAFPRWIGYVSLWMMVTAETGVAAMMFKSGPFSWNGLFPFYLAFSVAGIWMAALLFTLLRALGRQEKAGVQ